MHPSTEATTTREKAFWTRGLLQIEDPHDIQLSQQHKSQPDTGIASLVDMTRDRIFEPPISVWGNAMEAHYGDNGEELSRGSNPADPGIASHELHRTGARYSSSVASTCFRYTPPSVIHGQPPNVPMLQLYLSRSVPDRR